jgi:DNA-binding MarR family transcriptional regulator
MSPRRSRTRAELIGSVLESVTVLGRELAAGREPPFAGRRLSRNQLEAMFVLAHSLEPVTPGRLATNLGVTAGAVTQLVDALRAAGLVESAVHPADARCRVLRLTSSAQATVQAFESRAADRMSPWFDSLADGELTTVATLLSKARRA